jgi:hypothetical protein
MNVHADIRIGTVVPAHERTPDVIREHRIRGGVPNVL